MQKRVHRRNQWTSQHGGKRRYTRGARGGARPRGRSHLELQAQKLTLSNANELDWRATLARVAVRVKAGLSSELVARLAHLHTPKDEK